MTRRSRRYFARKKEDKETFWKCRCGHYEESWMHCGVCGNEPPWGCPGECCQYGDDDWGDEEDGEEWDFDEEEEFEGGSLNY